VGPFSPEVTKSCDRKRPCPAYFFFVLFSLYFFPRNFFSRTFFLVVVVQNVGWGVLCDVRGIYTTTTTTAAADRGIYAAAAATAAATIHVYPRAATAG
jgi:hypothetical protein